MLQVDIEQLDLRIVRRGSLFWGGDPRSLARRALQALPRLLEEELAALGLTESVELELPGVLRVQAIGSQEQLLRELSTGEGNAGIRVSLRQGLTAALIGVGGAETRPGIAPLTSEVATGRPVLGELLPLYLTGGLPARLRGTDAGLLAAYHRLLLVDGPRQGTAVPRPVHAREIQEAEEFLRALAEGFKADSGSDTESRRLRERVLAAVALAAQTGIHPYDAGVRTLLDTILPLGSPETETSGNARLRRLAHNVETEMTQEVRPDTGPGRARSTEAIRTASEPAERPVSCEASVLPLLAASALARNGVLERIEGQLVSIGRGEDLPLWIAGMVFKLGPPPVRGWRYPESVWQAVKLIADCPLLSSEGLIHLADDSAADWLNWLVAPDATIPDFAVRPACARARRPGVDRHVGAAVDWGLGEIGRSIWPSGDSPARSAWDRLGRLEARVTRTDEGLSVLVPLGYRHQMLLKAGWLDDIKDAKWLSVRKGRVVFRGG